MIQDAPFSSATPHPVRYDWPDRARGSSTELPPRPLGRRAVLNTTGSRPMFHKQPDHPLAPATSADQDWPAPSPAGCARPDAQRPTDQFLPKPILARIVTCTFHRDRIIFNPSGRYCPEPHRHHRQDPAADTDIKHGFPSTNVVLQPFK